MNDFTKDELKQICQFFNIAIEDFQEPESTYDLRDKIQSMIDNYCEHEKINPDCYCGQRASDGSIITECGYPPHNTMS